MGIFEIIIQRKKRGEKMFALLVDPDKISPSGVDKLVEQANDTGVDYFFIGGSLLVSDNLDYVVERIKNKSHIPVVLFPGNGMQICSHADAILLLSLISGRNPEMLIGSHVLAAPVLRKSGLEIIPTGYMLIDSGVATSASYMSNTTPIPHDKNDIALCTALAGEMLGLKMIFMDGGSGAKSPVSESMIQAVSENISVPLIVGGGIKTPEKALANCRAGADIIVVGNGIENDISLISSLSNAIKDFA